MYMEKYKKIISYFVLWICVCNFSCTEPFEVEDAVFESAMVIEATITDEAIIQTIKVSRSFPLDTLLTTGVANASVQISDNTGQVFNFVDSGNGNYTSENVFSAIPGNTYTLRIQTAEGNVYNATPSGITASATIEDLYARRELDNNGQEGVFIYLDSGNPSENATNFRYTYEETYQVIAPFYAPREAFVVSPLPNPQVDTRPREKDLRVCYATDLSNTVIQTSTKDVDGITVQRFPIRFISRENFIISHRYSILVKQIVQSPQAFAYYRTLNTLSSLESLFSQVQPGFLEGNVSSSNNSAELVIGFFEVASACKKRIFFSYEDLFPAEPLPNYAIDCRFTAPALLIPAPGGGRSPLIDGIDLGLIDYFDDYDQANPLNLRNFGPFLMTPAGCGDCTRFGSTTLPDFWTE